MVTRRTLLAGGAGVGAALLAGCSNPVGPGSSYGTETTGDGGGGGGESAGPPEPPGLSTRAFEAGGTIPRQFTCDGVEVSPRLSFEAGERADTLALVVDDPDAGEVPYVHWLLWNVPAATTYVPEDVPNDERVDFLGSAPQGTNDAGTVGYAGPCPPTGDGAHTYRFTLYAVGGKLDVEPGAKWPALESALQGHRTAKTVLRASYDRN